MEIRNRNAPYRCWRCAGGDFTITVNLTTFNDADKKWQVLCNGCKLGLSNIPIDGQYGTPSPDVCVLDAASRELTSAFDEIKDKRAKKRSGNWRDAEDELRLTHKVTETLTAILGRSSHFRSDIYIQDPVVLADDLMMCLSDDPEALIGFDSSERIQKSLLELFSLGYLNDRGKVVMVMTDEAIPAYGKMSDQEKRIVDFLAKYVENEYQNRAAADAAQRLDTYDWASHWKNK